MSKCPDVYEERNQLEWSLDEITSITDFKHKIIADVGSGTGNIAFKVTARVACVYAIEPSASFRQFIKDKASNNNINNIYVMDGFLHSIPLHNASVDILITSNAIGWRPNEEILEIERVVKPNGYVIHLLISPKDQGQEIQSIHTILTQNFYHLDDLSFGNTKKLRYWKKIIKF